MVTLKFGRLMLAFLSAMALVFQMVYSQEQIRPTARDVAALNEISGVEISPDGQTVVYSLTTHTFDSTARYKPCDDEGGWTTKSQLWTAEVMTGNAKKLTGGDCDFSPRWSPDGSEIAFIREKDDSTGLLVIAVDGGEARPIDVGALMPEDPQWSPDGSGIAFTAENPLTEAKKLEKWRIGNVEVFDEEWRSWSIWVVPAAGGEARRISTGPEHVVDYCWSPDGARLAALTTPSSDPYTAARDALPKMYFLDGSEAIDLESQPVMAGRIRWSPDGRYLGYLHAERGLSIFDAIRINDLKNQTASDILKEQDWTIVDFAWASDSRSLTAKTINRTISGLYRVNLAGEVEKRFDLNRRVLKGGLSVDSSGRFLACLLSHVSEPPFVGRLDSESGEITKVLNVDSRIDSWTLAEAEIVRWVNNEGVELDGLLFFPAQTEADATTTLMVFPHGGPDGVSMESFDSWWHFFCAHGYSVFRPNYRGGIGYGFDLYEANRGRLGEIEWIDIESGVDHLIEAGKAEGDNLVYGGWSWGGYITAWAIGHTDRYKVAVIGAGVSDVRSQYVTSDINHGVAALWEFNGNPWQQPDNFEKANPARFFANVTTPTLVIHGKDDERVTFMQGITTYRALFDVGCEVKFLAYPGEPHWPFTPVHHAHLLNAWLDWYGRHLK